MTTVRISTRTLRAAVAGVLLAAALAMAAPPAAHAAFSNVSLVASNNQVSATGVTHTITFQVGALDKGLLVVLPAGFTGLALDNVSVQTSADGTTFASPALETALASSKVLSTDGMRVGINLDDAVALGTWVRIVITGLTNPGSTGDSTLTVGGKLTDLTLADLDAAIATLLGLLAESASIVTTIVALATNGISNDVTVAPALSFSVNASSHSWSLDPAGTATSTSVTDVLTVATNAASYTIQASVASDLLRVGTTGANAGDKISASGAAADPHFGYKISSADAALDSGLLRSWSTTASNLASGWVATGLTNGEQTTVTYDVKIDYTKSPGKYATTITYRIVPTY